MSKICALVSIMFLLAACTNAREQSGQSVIHIAYMPITHSAAIMLMPHVACDSIGYEIELVRFTTWPEVVEALRTGRVHGASMLFEVALVAYKANPALQAISLSHRDGNVIVAANHIQTFDDLIGETIAIPHTLSPHYTFFRLALQREEIDISQVNIIEISPAEMPFTMAAGAIAAFVVAEPWGTLAEVRGVGHILELSNDVLPGSVCCLLMFNSAALEGRPDLHAWLLDALHDAAELVANEDEKVFEVFRQASSFEPEVMRRSIPTTNFLDLVFTQNDYNFSTQYVLRFGVLDTVPDFCDFVWHGCHE